MVALSGLLALLLIALGLRFQSLNKTSLGVSNIFEDGLLFGIFAILFAPIYLAWMGAQSLWHRLRPPQALSTDDDDPVWGRQINRRVVETAFLAVQEARNNHNPSIAKRFISQELYKQLRRECERAKTNHEIESGKSEVKVNNIVFAEERIDREHFLCYFNATVNATRVGDADALPENFEQRLEFARALPEIRDARWQLMKLSDS